MVPRRQHAPPLRLALLTYWLYWLAVQVAAVLPRTWGLRLACLGGGVAYTVNGGGRAAVRANLQHVLGHPPPERFVRAVFRHGALNYYDLFPLSRLGAAELTALIDVCGWEHLEAA